MVLGLQQMPAKDPPLPGHSQGGIDVEKKHRSSVNTQTPSTAVYNEGLSPLSRRNPSGQTVSQVVVVLVEEVVVVVGGGVVLVVDVVVVVLVGSPVVVVG